MKRCTDKLFLTKLQGLGLILLVSVISVSESSSLCSISDLPESSTFRSEEFDGSVHNITNKLIVTCTLTMQEDAINITHELLQLQLTANNSRQQPPASVIMEIVCQSDHMFIDERNNNAYFCTYLPAFTCFPNLVSLSIRGCKVMVPSHTTETNCRHHHGDVDIGATDKTGGLEELRLYHSTIDDSLANSNLLCDLIETLRVLAFSNTEHFYDCASNNRRCQDLIGLSQCPRLRSGTPLPLELIDLSNNGWFSECFLCNFRHKGVFNEVKMLNLSHGTIHRQDDDTEILDPLLNFAAYFPNIETIDLKETAGTNLKIIGKLRDTRDDRRRVVTVFLGQIKINNEFSISDLDSLERLDGVYFDFHVDNILCFNNSMKVLEATRLEMGKRAIFRPGQKYHHVSELPCFACEEDKHKPDNERLRERLGHPESTNCKLWITYLTVSLVTSAAVLVLAVILTIRYSHKFVFHATLHAIKSVLFLSSNHKLTSNVFVSFHSTDRSFAHSLKQQLEKRNIRVQLHEEQRAESNCVKNGTQEDDLLVVSEQGQQVLFVCSVAYIENKWYDLDFRHKHERVFQQQSNSRVVVILLDESRLHHELVNMQNANGVADAVTMPWQWKNCTTVIRKNTFRLWSKLTYVLKQPKVFMSYDDSDWPYVSYVAQRLQSSGYRLCLQHRDISPGQAQSDGMLQAVHGCQFALMICSPAYISNDWAVETYRVAFHRMLNERPGFLVIILLDDADRDIRAKQVEAAEDLGNADLVWSWDNCLTIKAYSCCFWTRLHYALRQQDGADAVTSL